MESAEVNFYQSIRKILYKNSSTDRGSIQYDSDLVLNLGNVQLLFLIPALYGAQIEHHWTPPPFRCSLVMKLTIIQTWLSSLFCEKRRVNKLVWQRLL